MNAAHPLPAQGGGTKTLLSQRLGRGPLRACPRGHQGEWTLYPIPPRMYQDARDQIAPTTDPDLSEAHSGHSQHSADAAQAGTAAALGSSPRLSWAALHPCSGQLPGHRLYVPRLHPVPSPLLSVQSEEELQSPFSRLSCLPRSPSPACSCFPDDRWAAQGPPPPPRRWCPRPQAGLGRREALPGRTLLQSTQSTKGRPAHGRLPAVPTPPPSQGGGSSSPEQTTWASRWKSQPLRNLFSLQFRMVSSSPLQVMYFLATLPSWRGTCRAGPHPSSWQNTVASSRCRPQRRSTPFTFLISGSPAQGLRPFTSRTSRKVPSAKHTGRGVQYLLAAQPPASPTATPSRALPGAGQPWASLRGQRRAAQRPSWLNDLWTPSLILQHRSLCSRFALGPTNHPVGQLRQDVKGRTQPQTLHTDLQGERLSWRR